MASTSQLISELQSVSDKLEANVTTQAKKVHVALDKIDKTVNNVAQKIKELRKQIINGEEEKIAQENLLRIEHQINDQLQSYQAVRKSVIGVIKDFDINLARNSTISQLSEELWMSSSRYWLSYAFIAISAWVQNNKEVCRNAVEEGLRCDFNKTSLFFCLLNLRFNRNPSAREWLYEYFNSVDSEKPPRETTLILRAYLCGVFGRDSQLDNFIRTTVEKWVTELNTNSSISTNLVEGYNKYIAALPSSQSTFSANILESHCDTLPAMRDSLVSAGRYKTVLQKVANLDSVEEKFAGGDFIRQVDALLDDLVNNYDEEEIRLNNEKKFYQIVMEHKGDVEAAKKEYEVFMDANKEEPNIGEQMFRWVAYPDKGVDLSIQKFAVSKTKVWFIDAINTYDHTVKGSAPGVFKLSIDFWEDTTDGKDREAIKKGLRDKFEAEKSKLVVFTKPNVVLTIVAAILLVIGIVIGVAAASTSWGWYGYLVGPIAFAILAAVVVLKTVPALKAYPKRIHQAENVLEACLDEIDGYRTTFEEATQIKDEVLKKLEYI